MKKMLPEIGIPIKPGARILVTGASGDIGMSLLKYLTHYELSLGMHCFSNERRLVNLINSNLFKDSKAKIFQADLSRAEECTALVDSFISWAGGIDGLVLLTGGIRRPVSWEELTYDDWIYDINVNLTSTFFTAQKTMQWMKKFSDGGRIITVSTASARHGGGGRSMGYGVARAGIECLTKGLAREGAPYSILVNCVAPGFIDTQFQTAKAGKTKEDYDKRIKLIPLKRAGLPEEVATSILYFLSEWSSFITGECIAISGGDWL